MDLSSRLTRTPSHHPSVASERARVRARHSRNLRPSLVPDIRGIYFLASLTAGDDVFVPYACSGARNVERSSLEEGPRAVPLSRSLEAALEGCKEITAGRVAGGLFARLNFAYVLSFGGVGVNSAAKWAVTHQTRTFRMEPRSEKLPERSSPPSTPLFQVHCIT